MSKQKKPAGTAASQTAEQHQTGSGLTTNQGLPLSDNQNSLKGGGRGPALLEDFILREKITHFDHERIPERIVHARGSAAHGYFQAYAGASGLSKAGFLSDPKVKTPVFARFSTVAGGAGSVDLARDVRGFAVKFYTQEGNFDLVGNNIPVFFIQDAMKFPDLIHAVKMESDRGYPQAASAHDTFWDFITLMPESMHMILWAMSDRAIPRSLRMMEGFGIHTFRLIKTDGTSNFVKFHWRPRLGTAAVLWDEAVKINGADSDYHRRDLYEAIEGGDYPEFELGVQVFDQEMADSLPFDVLDPTKLIPEETIPIQMIGKMTLDRNPDNFFAETEQVAFCPSHIVPGIDFSEDPLLQGRLFSYLDTQLSRLGSPNFHQLPINQPKCPFANMQRDGHMQFAVPKGRANYEPNSIEASGPRESVSGFQTVPAAMAGFKTRLRSESFADHYSQARLFYRSLTAPEQLHIRKAFVFELSKVTIPDIRKRMMGHLNVIDAALGNAVADGLGMSGQAIAAKPFVAPLDLPESPALRLYRYPPSLKGRKIGVLLGKGFRAQLQASLLAEANKEGASVKVIALKIGGETDGAGLVHAADQILPGAPSVLFDTVAILSGPEGDAELAGNPDAQTFLADAHRHLKVVGLAGIPLLLKASGVEPGAGVCELARSRDVAAYLSEAKRGKVWERESKTS